MKPTPTIAKLGFAMIILLLVVSTAGLALAARARERVWVAASVVGLAGIAAALLGGSSFMNGQSDAMSFLMASGLGLAIAAYAWALYTWARGSAATAVAN
jgi:hypothetical protein